MNIDITSWNDRAEGTFVALLGIELVTLDVGRVQSRLAIRPDHLAPNGYLHAASVVGLADTSAGVGCLRSLPDDAAGFTTIELKSNFVGTLTGGAAACEATLVHGGRTTQLWDAHVRNEETGKLLATFRCTQLVLYAR